MKALSGSEHLWLVMFIVVIVNCNLFNCSFRMGSRYLNPSLSRGQKYVSILYNKSSRAACGRSSRNGTPLTICSRLFNKANKLFTVCHSYLIYAKVPFCIYGTFTVASRSTYTPKKYHFILCSVFIIIVNQYVINFLTIITINF